MSIEMLYNLLYFGVRIPIITSALAKLAFPHCEPICSEAPFAGTLGGRRESDVVSVHPAVRRRGNNEYRFIFQ